MAIRIIIADDHGVVAEGLKHVVETQPDMEVVSLAIDGREAVRQARELQPDVVLMDLSMPVMDGFEATRRLKATAAYRAVPIVAVTGLTDPGVINRAYAAGICDYIAKPFKRNQLVDLVFKHLALATCEE